MNRSMN